MKTSKGFTIIELLVVIAIIAVLAAVVMVNVTSYVGKAKDGAVKADLAQLPTVAAVFYDDNNSSYSGFCANSDVVKAVTAANTSAGKGYGCNDSATNWAACVNLAYNTSAAWCVDSQDSAKSITAGNCTTSIVACP